ncbi:MAG: serine/threonine-protein kinase PknK [Planctomycetota bacterium]
MIPRASSPRAPRFRLTRELGSGATGRVVHGTLAEAFPPYPAGMEVAVKYLHRRLEKDPAALATFEAEAVAGSVIRHGNVVHVLHAGEDENGRYLLLPFVPGKTLREVLQESGALPEPLVRSIARQIASGLASLHGAGMIHGDLKPENVRLDAEGNAVILDLGFARSATPAEVPHHTPRPGSLPYLSPEQARGGTGTEKSDVFALGILAFELATGVHPFSAFAGRKSRGDQHASISGSGSSGLVSRTALEKVGADRLIAAIALARFVPPSRVVPQISPFLDHLLRELLQRDPGSRPAAAEVERRLVEQESSAWWRKEVEFDPGARRGGSGERDAAHRTPLVGREAEMETLLATYEAAVGRAPDGTSPRAVWIRGAPGSGKSRLVNEFAARARMREQPPLFLYGRCRELEEERPAQPVLRLLERYLRLPPNAAPTEREIEILNKLLSPKAAETLVRALDPRTGDDTPLAVPVALGLWLAALAAAVPLVLFLDDVTWAGDDTLDVLGYVAGRLSGSRAMLVLGDRAGATARRPERLEELARKLEQGPGLVRMDLAPLDERAIAALVERMFHHSAPRLRLSQVLWERSRGNPGMLSELLRGLVARNEARPHPDGSGLALAISPDEMPLPGSLKAAIADSFRRLPPEDRKWLRRLAVAGGRIETDFLLQAFPEAKRSEVDLVLSRLVRSQWLAPAGARFRFTRPALREAVYRGIPRAERLKLHAAAARALAAAGAESASLDRTFQRAFHLKSAEDSRGLLAVLPDLLARLLQAGQPQRVHVLAQWGLASLEGLDHSPELERMRITLLESAVDAADRLGYRREQRDLLDRLADLEIDPKTDPELVGRVYLLHARYGVSTGQYGLARGWLRSAVEMFELAGKERERSESLRRLSLVQSHVGELEEARELAKEALERSQTEAQKALARLSIGAIEVLEDRFEAALRQADRALAILRASEGGGRPGILAAAHLLRARVYRVVGDPARAHASASRALELSRVAGERRLEAEAGARLGGILLDLDRPREAEATLREALRLAVEIEDRRGEAMASIFLGILLWEGAVPEAEAVLARAVDLAVQMGLNRVEAVTRSIQARIARAAGQLDAALESSSKAMELLATFGAELSDRIVIAGSHALVLSTRAEKKEARSIEKKLRERLSRENARIKSPLLRMRQKRASIRLLAAVLSPDGPVFPRVREEVREEAAD